MTFTPENLRDFLGAFAVLALLAASYGGLSRQLLGQFQARTVLGILFGICAWLQMQMPIEMVEGVIVDMRNAPIVLAGAFLGIRGVLCCLIIAVCVRFSIGGIGWPAGVVAMMVAGGVGYAWHVLTRHLKQRGFAVMLALGLVANLHFIGAVALPPDIAWSFVTQAAPFIFKLNVTGITAVALLLEREQQRLDREEELSRSARMDPHSGVLLPGAFLDELRHARALGEADRPCGLAIITPKHGHWIGSVWGKETENAIHGAFRKQIEAQTALGRWAGSDGRGRLLVPVTARELVRVGFAMDVTRAVSAQSVALKDGTNVKIAVDVVVKPIVGPIVDVDALDTFVAKALTHRDPILHANPAPRAPLKALRQDADAPFPSTRALQARLFAEVDLMITARNT